MVLPLFYTALAIITAQISPSMEILHIPRKEVLEGEPITIEVAVTQPLLVRKGELKWRVKKGNSKIGYKGVLLVREGNSFVSKILPLKIEKGSSGLQIEYYIWMVTSKGEVLTLPEEDPGLHPFEIEILPSWLEILTPLPGEGVEDEKPEILGLFFPSVLPEEISVFLDEKPTEVEITEDYFLILPQYSLAPGTHNVKVVKKGTGEREWSFLVLSKTAQERIVLQGTVSPAFQYGSRVGKGDDFPLPFSEGSFLLFDGYGMSNIRGYSFNGWLSRDPTYGEPFRFGGEVKMEGDPFSEDDVQLSLGFGDIYPSFSRLTLFGISPRGLETSLAYRNWNIDLVALKTQKADSLSLSFDQYLMGAKATVHPFEKSKVEPLRDLTLTSTVLSGWEDSTSAVSNLSKIPEGNQLYALGFQMDLTEDLLIRGEVALSHRDGNQGPSGQQNDNAYEVEASYQGLPVGIDLQYEETGKDYQTFGNPYLEPGRKGPSLRVDWEATQLSMRGGYGRFLSNGSLEPAWNRINGRLQYALKEISDFYLLLNWIEKEPLYNSKSVTGGVIYRFPPFSLKGSHTEVWTDFTIQTRTQMESVGVEWKTWKDRLTTLVEIQSNRSKSSQGLIDQVRNMPRVVIDYKATSRDEIELRGNWIDQEDGVIPSSSYNQQVVRIVYTRRF